MIALTCSPVPEGFARWSLRLLEEKVVELNIVEKASDNTIGRTLKKLLKPHRNRQWVIPPDSNAGFVAAMEDVLDTYLGEFRAGRSRGAGLMHADLSALPRALGS